MNDKAQETSPRSEHQQSSYTTEMGDRICEQISGGKSLRRICREFDWAPGRRTVFKWLREQPDFEVQYRIAIIEGAHAHADDAIEIADDGRNDWMLSNDPDNPGYKVNKEHIARSRLRVDTRKWHAARMYPRVYGERVSAELTGADGGPIEVANVADDEIAQRLAFILQQGAAAQETTH